MDLELKGLKALVTGGTRGIGRAIVDGLAKEGVSVAFCARDPEAVSQTERETTAVGVEAFGKVLDVGNHAALRNWVGEAAAKLGGVDVVIANASALDNGLSEESWRAVFGVDLLGCVGLIEAALPFLKASNAGSIVSIASVQSRELTYAPGAYGPLKAAVVHYTSGVAARLAREGVRANTVSPGNVYFDGGHWSRLERTRPEVFEAALADNPLGRMATPQEVASAVLFLASPAASFVTGINFLVDGGLSRSVQF